MSSWPNKIYDSNRNKSVSETHKFAWLVSGEPKYPRNTLLIFETNWL